jgi:hypothetical protein
LNNTTAGKTINTDMIAFCKFVTITMLCLAAAVAIAAAPQVLNDPVDVSGDFRALDNSYYFADKVSEFDPATHVGKIFYQRAQCRVPHAFDNDLSLITAVGGGWQKIEAGQIPAVFLVSDNTALPHLALAQSTAQMGWSQIELRVYAKDTTTAKGLVFLPGDSAAHEVKLAKSGNVFRLDADPLNGKVTWPISDMETH